MDKVAAKMPNKYLLIGTQLGIDYNQLEGYRLKHQGISENIFIEIFNTWVKKPGATWSAMIDILKSDVVDEKTLAEDLEVSIGTDVHAHVPQLEHELAM